VNIETKNAQVHVREGSKNSRESSELEQIRPKFLTREKEGCMIDASWKETNTRRRGCRWKI
jgi:hypothetical protein